MCGKERLPSTLKLFGDFNYFFFFTLEWEDSRPLASSYLISTSSNISYIHRFLTLSVNLTSIEIAVCLESYWALTKLLISEVSGGSKFLMLIMHFVKEYFLFMGVKQVFSHVIASPIVLLIRWKVNRNGWVSFFFVVTISIPLPQCLLFVFSRENSVALFNHSSWRSY